jgi:hypothetical protein
MLSQFPLTDAVRHVLDTTTDQTVVADLMFLERWEIAPLPGAAAALRVTQIRRANPDLAAAVHAELATLRN